MTLAMVQSVESSQVYGGQADFGLLAREFYVPVYRFIAQQVPSPDDAADLTQEAFLRAQRSFGQFDPAREFAPWIFTIARRTLADFYRQRENQHELLEDAHADPGPDPRERLDSVEGADRIWEHVKRLKPRYHQVLLLHYRENLSLKETAAAMGLTTVHVKVLLFRARAALKHRLPADTHLKEETRDENLDR